MRTTPNVIERILVARCLLEGGVLIGSVDEIWTHGDARRALTTLRMCVEGITLLIDAGFEISISNIKGVVMQTDGLQGVPFVLDEMTSHLIGDSLARRYWDGIQLDASFPVRCPRCKILASYVGLNEITCKSSVICEDLRRDG